MARKCPGCGANVSDYDKACSYCGSNNPDYRSLDQEVLILMGEGVEAFRSEQYTAAIRSFVQVIDLAPEYFDAYFYLSACLSALDRPGEAIRYMEQAQAIRPGSAPICYNLGVLCQRVGRKDDARKYLEQALVLAQTDPGLTDRREFEKQVRKALAKFNRWKLF